MLSDNYGFVTFAYKVDAYEAVEHGNDDPTLPKYDLSFGGRRAFCKETYADLGMFRLLTISEIIDPLELFSLFFNRYNSCVIEPDRI